MRTIHRGPQARPPGGHEDGVQEKTIDQLIEHYGPSQAVQAITREAADRFVATRKIIHQDHQGKQLSSWGRSKHHRNARAIFNKATRWGYIVENPFTGLQTKKLTSAPWQHLSPEAFKSLLSAVSDLRRRCLYAVQYGCGLRYGEGVNLLWDGRCLDFERGRVNIENRDGSKDVPPFRVKDYEARSIPMPQWVSDMLADLQAQAEQGCPFVFLTVERWELVRDKWRAMCAEGRAGQCACLTSLKGGAYMALRRAYTVIILH